MRELGRRGISIGAVVPLLDGAVPDTLPVEEREDGLRWRLRAGGTLELRAEAEDNVLRLTVALRDADAVPLSLGLRLVDVAGVDRYLRNGYHSWDGSFFAEPGTPPGDGPPGRSPALGFAMVALLPAASFGALVLGFERHDRFQSRFRFGGTSDAMTIDVETLLDRTGATAGETLLLFDGSEVESTLVQWSERVAAAAPLSPRIPGRRIRGWCSWYNHYAMIDEATIRAELASARAFRDATGSPLDIFLIDDGFTPEMGDWLDVKPQFPHGMAPLVAEIAAAGFVPGLWIAPFLVGNRSRLYAEHPDWVVRDHDARPIAEMRFYGEFRWHKRSEEYYCLDITHPDAAAYLRQVFRTWRHDWGAGYFKADFLYHGMAHGPDEARWHEDGLSRVDIYRRMLALVREEVGDATLLACGAPLWASTGYADAMRIGRDVGVKWFGEYSGESLLRDLPTRMHAHGRLWQADPDCLLLRDRFHELSDAQLDTLARFGANAGGVLMTSDTLAQLPAERRDRFAALLREELGECRFPRLGARSSLIDQKVTINGAMRTFRINAGATEWEGIPPFTTVRLD